MKQKVHASLTLFTICLLLHFSTMAQNIISGSVKDSKGEPLIGVTVRLKEDASVGTTSDDAGKFSLKVPDASGTLLFTYVGYKDSEAPFGPGKNTVNLVMKSDLELEEVIVVGYGTQKKSDVTGAISSLKGDQIEGLPNA